MLAGAAIAWNRQEPFMSELEVARVSTAARSAAGLSDGIPLVFFANDDDPTVSFLATRAANVIRAGMPPDRIRDVYVVVPAATEGSPTSPEREALVRLWGRDVEDASDGGRAVLFLLAPFDRVDLARAQALPDTRVSTGVFVMPRPTTPASAPAGPLEPSSPGAIAWATVAMLALLVLCGYGWGRAALGDAFTAGMLARRSGWQVLRSSRCAGTARLPLRQTERTLVSTLAGGAVRRVAVPSGEPGALSAQVEGSRPAGGDRCGP
jgi:hypothetical protein